MKNAFYLLAFLLFVSVFFLRCDNQTKEPAEDAMASSSSDSSGNILILPDTITIHIMAQSTTPSRSVEDAKVIIHRGATTTSYSAPDGVALVAILKGDELEIKGPRDNQGNPRLYEPLYITLTDITSLKSLTVYLKFINQTAPFPKNHYVFGKVYNDSRIVFPDVNINSDARNFMTKSASDGKYQGLKDDNHDFDLKFKKGENIKVELQVKGVKDTLQLDVFLDDNTILEGG